MKRFYSLYWFLGLLFIFTSVVTVHAEEQTRVEIVPQISHKANYSINATAFSPDGRRIFTAGADGLLKLWDVSTGKLIRTYEGHQDAIGTAALSSDGLQMLSASNDNTIKLWDVTSGRVIRSAEGEQLNTVAFSPDGKKVLLAYANKILRVEESSTGKAIHNLEHGDSVTVAVFSSDGASILSSSEGELILWDAASGQKIRNFEGKDNAILSVAFTPDGQKILSAGVDTLKVWETATGKPLSSAKVGYVLAYSPDCTQVLAVGGAGKLELHDADGKLIMTFDTPGTVTQAAFSKDGTNFVATDDTELMLLNTKTEKPVRIFERLTNTISSIAISPVSRQLCSSHDDNKLSCWDLTTGQLQSTLKEPEGEISSIAFTPDGKRALSVVDRDMLMLWDVATASPVKTLTGLKGDVEDNDIVFAVVSPDGREALGGGVGTKVWDIETGKLLKTLKLPNTNEDDSSENFFVTVAFSPDGTQIASGGQSVVIWDAKTGKLIKMFDADAERVNSVAFSPDGRQLLTSGSAVKLWDAKSYELFRTFGDTRSAADIALFSADGRQVVTSDGTCLRVWDAMSGKEVLTMFASPTREWAVVTPAGFFDASEGGMKLLAAVRGVDVLPIEQYREKFQRKDIIRALLAGDARQYEEAAAKLNAK